MTFLTKRRRKWLNIALREPAYVTGLLKNKARKKLLLDYRFLKGYSFPPYALNIVPTYRCNLRCKMCMQYEGDYKKGAAQVKVGVDELTLEQWKAVIDNVGARTSPGWHPHINIFGGEPLLYQDILGFIGYIVAKGLTCSIVTNGVLLEKYAEDLVHSGIEAVNFSLDGPEDVNNEIRGTKDAFQRTVQGVRTLQAIKAQHNLNRPRVNLNCVITPWNVERLPELIKVAEDLNIDTINFQHLMFSSEALNQANGACFQQLFGYDPNRLDNFPVLATDGIDVAQVAAFVSSARQRSAIPIRFLPNIPPATIADYYQKLDHQFSRNVCVTPWVRATITPRGDVTPCIGYCIGNVLEHPFTEIWNSPAYRKFRFELQKHGLFPGCARCCHRRY